MYPHSSRLGPSPASDQEIATCYRRASWAREHAKQVNDPVPRQCLIAMERRWLSRVHGDEFFGRPPEKPGLTRHWQGRWIGGLQGRFRTFQVDPKDLAGPQVNNSPHQSAYAEGETHDVSLFAKPPVIAGARNWVLPNHLC
jgi:hypothetical protein